MIYISSFYPYYFFYQSVLEKIRLAVLQCSGNRLFYRLMCYLGPAVPLVLELFLRIGYILEKTTILNSFRTTSRIFFPFFFLKYAKF